MNWKWRVLALLLVALAAMGCRKNLLPEYAGRINATHAQVRVTTVGTVSVRTGSDKKKQSAVEKMANAAVGAMALNAALNAEQKLRDTMPPERVQRIMAKEMGKMAPGVGFPFVGGEDGSNTRLTVDVRGYGIEAAGDQTPASARFHIYGSLTYLPEAKLIWEYSVWIDIPLESVHVVSASTSITGDVSNVMAISNLDRRDIKRLFTRATKMAAQKFMNKLASDYQDGRAKWEAKYGQGQKPPPPTAPKPEADDDDEDEPAAEKGADAPAADQPKAGPSANPNEI